MCSDGTKENGNDHAKLYGIYTVYNSFFLCSYWDYAEWATPTFANHHQWVQAPGDHEGGVLSDIALSTHRSACSLLDTPGATLRQDSAAGRPRLPASDFHPACGKLLRPP